MYQYDVRLVLYFNMRHGRLSRTSSCKLTWYLKFDEDKLENCSHNRSAQPGGNAFLLPDEQCS